MAFRKNDPSRTNNDIPENYAWVHDPAFNNPDIGEWKPKAEDPPDDPYDLTNPDSLTVPSDYIWSVAKEIWEPPVDGAHDFRPNDPNRANNAIPEGYVWVTDGGGGGSGEWKPPPEEPDWGEVSAEDLFNTQSSGWSDAQIEEMKALYRLEGPDGWNNYLRTHTPTHRKLTDSEVSELRALGWSDAQIQTAQDTIRNQGATAFNQFKATVTPENEPAPLEVTLPDGSPLPAGFNLSQDGQSIAVGGKVFNVNDLKTSHLSEMYTEAGYVLGADGTWARPVLPDPGDPIPQTVWAPLLDVLTPTQIQAIKDANGFDPATNTFPAGTDLQAAANNYIDAGEHDDNDGSGGDGFGVIPGWRLNESSALGYSVEQNATIVEQWALGGPSAVEAWMEANDPDLLSTTQVASYEALGYTSAQLIEIRDAYRAGGQAALNTWLVSNPLLPDDSQFDPTDPHSLDVPEGYEWVGDGLGQGTGAWKPPQPTSDLFDPMDINSKNVPAGYVWNPDYARYELPSVLPGPDLGAGKITTGPAPVVDPLVFTMDDLGDVETQVNPDDPADPFLVLADGTTMLSSLLTPEGYPPPEYMPASSVLDAILPADIDADGFTTTATDVTPPVNAQQGPNGDWFDAGGALVMYADGSLPVEDYDAQTDQQPDATNQGGQALVQERPRWDLALTHAGHRQTQWDSEILETLIRVQQEPYWIPESVWFAEQNLTDTYIGDTKLTPYEAPDSDFSAQSYISQWQAANGIQAPGNYHHTDLEGNWVDVDGSIIQYANGDSNIHPDTGEYLNAGSTFSIDPSDPGFSSTDKNDPNVPVGYTWVPDVSGDPDLGLWTAPDISTSNNSTSDITQPPANLDVFFTDSLGNAYNDGYELIWENPNKTPFYDPATYTADTTDFNAHDKNDPNVPFGYVWVPDISGDYNLGEWQSPSSTQYQVPGDSNLTELSTIVGVTDPDNAYLDASGNALKDAAGNWIDGAGTIIQYADGRVPNPDAAGRILDDDGFTLVSDPHAVTPPVNAQEGPNGDWFDAGGLLVMYADGSLPGAADSGDGTNGVAPPANAYLDASGQALKDAEGNWIDDTGAIIQNADGTLPIVGGATPVGALDAFDPYNPSRNDNNVPAGHVWVPDPAQNNPDIGEWLPPDGGTNTQAFLDDDADAGDGTDPGDDIPPLQRPLYDTFIDSGYSEQDALELLGAWSEYEATKDMSIFTDAVNRISGTGDGFEPVDAATAADIALADYIEAPEKLTVAQSTELDAIETTIQNLVTEMGGVDLTAEKTTLQTAIENRTEEARKAMARQFALDPSGMQDGRAIRAFAAIEGQRLQDLADLDLEIFDRVQGIRQTNLAALTQSYQALGQLEQDWEELNINQRQYMLDLGFKKEELGQDAAFFAAEMDARAEEFAARLGLDVRNLTTQERIQMAELEEQRIEFEGRLAFDLDSLNVNQNLALAELNEDQRQFNEATATQRQQFIDQYDLDILNLTQREREFVATLTQADYQFEETLREQARQFNDRLGIDIQGMNQEQERFFADLVERGFQFDADLDQRYTALAGQINLDLRALDDADKQFIIEMNQRGYEFDASLKADNERFEAEHGFRLTQLEQADQQFLRSLADNNFQFTAQMAADRARFEDEYQINLAQMSQDDKQFIQSLASQEWQLTQTLQEENARFQQQNNLDILALNQTDRLSMAQLAQQQLEFEGQLLQRESEFDQNLGFSYAQLTQTDRDFLANLAQREREFSANLDLAYDQMSQEDRQFLADYNLQLGGYHESVRQFNQTTQFEIDKFAAQYGLDELQATALARQVNAQIMNSTRQASAQIQQTWASLTGNTGTVAPMTAVDFGVDVSHLDAQTHPTILMNTPEWSALSTSFEATFGRSATTGEMTSLMAGEDVNIAGAPTLEARSMATKLAQQTMDRAVQVAEFAEQLDLDKETFEQAIIESDRQWGLQTQNAATVEGLDPDVFTLAKYNFDTAVMNGMPRQDAAAAIVANFTDDQDPPQPLMDAAAFLRAADLADNNWGVEQDRLATELDITRANFETAQTQIELEERRSTQVWNSLLSTGDSKSIELAELVNSNPTLARAARDLFADGGLTLEELELLDSGEWADHAAGVAGMENFRLLTESLLGPMTQGEWLNYSQNMLRYGADPAGDVAVFESVPKREWNADRRQWEPVLDSNGAVTYDSVSSLPITYTHPNWVSKLDPGDVSALFAWMNGSAYTPEREGQGNGFWAGLGQGIGGGAGKILGTKAATIF